MDEEHWLTTTAPQGMLNFLRARATDRKLRLFAVACCRNLCYHFLDQPARAADDMGRTVLDIAERYADGLASEDEWSLALQLARRGIEETRENDKARYYARQAAGFSADTRAFEAATNSQFRAWSAAVHEAAPGPPDDAPLSQVAKVVRAATAARVCHLVRDIFGNPFRPLPAIAPSVLHWHDGLVRRLAAEVYEYRLPPSGHLDPQRLAVLADALEEAGADAELVEHLRGPGAHYRGCHAVDMLTGRT